jgi:hypothetical protein
LQAIRQEIVALYEAKKITFQKALFEKIMQDDIVDYSIEKPRE